MVSGIDLEQQQRPRSAAITHHGFSNKHRRLRSAEENPEQLIQKVRQNPEKYLSQHEKRLYDQAIGRVNQVP